MDSSRALRRLVRKITVETLWVYIIRILISSGPMRAYEIKKKLFEVFGLKVPTITVYTVVYRMCGEGLLETVKSSNEVLYRVTEKGIKEFQNAMQLLENMLTKLKL